MMNETHNLLSRSEWQQACHQRAAVYGWFSALYAKELSASMLASYEAGEMATLLEGLRRVGLTDECQRLKTAVARLHDVPYAHLELASDFAHVFLLDAKAGALPYASIYKSNADQFCGPAEQRMRSFLAQSSLALQEDFKEPADHLAIYLAVMVKLIEQVGRSDTAEAIQALDQAAFLQEGLLDWLPLFADKCQQVETRFDFYPALARLLLAFAQHDLLFLQDVAQGAAD